MYEALKERIQSDARAVENYLDWVYAGFHDTDTSALTNAEFYSITAGGKRVRPFLVIEFCHAFGGSTEASLPFAAAVEMMHTFSLIHDDLPCMDNDDLRRGKPTLHRVCGEATALLAGDSLSLRAVETILSNKHLPSDVLVRASLALTVAAGGDGMIGGQIMDMNGERESLCFDKLIKLHGKKTGRLIGVSAYLGAIAAGLDDDDARVAAAMAYASRVGLVFQIIDDVLDVTSDAKTLGKNIGVDTEHNKTTFMTFMTQGEAREYAARLTEEARTELSEYENTEILCDFASYLLDRSY